MDQKIKELCDNFRETSLAIHRCHQNGHLEKIYENALIIEVKACKTLVDDHTAQLLGYLRSSRTEHGLLINFGSPKLQIKKYLLST